MSDVERFVGNILIVDDVSRNIQILGTILRSEGYSLAFATSGQQALEIVASQHFDLILLDVMMPGMNGFEVCQKLQADPSTAQIPVIFLTAKTSSEDIVQGFEAGAVDYVTKPFNAPELLARVRNHLRLQQAEETLRKQNAELIKVNDALQQTMHQLKTLEGLLPICMYCKKIRQQGGDPKNQEAWLEVETYIEQHSEAVFSHGCCPSCLEAHFPKTRVRR
jgi:phosphoserine phosphatase RsbU/P